MGDVKLRQSVIELKRHQAKRRKAFLSVFGCLVVLVTAWALMTPAVSVTQDAASSDVGIYINSSNNNGESQSSSADSTTSGNRENAVQGAGETVGASDNLPSSTAIETSDSDSNSAVSPDESLANNASVDDAQTHDASAGALSSDFASASEVDASEQSPAQSFYGELIDADGNIVLAVKVEAPDGALPEGSAMEISGITEDDVRPKVEGAIEKSGKSKDDIKAMTAVDIKFVDIDGNEIEPAKKVEVKITSPKVGESKNPVLVHVVDRDKPAQTAKTDEAEVVASVEVVNKNDADKTVGTEDTLKFRTREFSPYVIVEMKEIAADVISASGENFEITVAYGEDAGIPDGARLEATEIPEGTAEFEQCLSASRSNLDSENGAISFARFFDITILNGEDKIEPSAPVQVTIKYDSPLDLPDDSTLSVVHFVDEQPRGAPEVITGIALHDDASTVVYNQSSFSVTGTVVQTPEASHHYALVIKHTDGNYYVVETDGTLTQLSSSDVTLNNGAVTSVKMINPITWTYTDIGYGNYNIWHDSDAWQYDVPGTSLPKHYLHRFLNVDVADGYEDVRDTQQNVWSEAVQYNTDTHLINHYDHYLGVSQDADGTLRISGLNNFDNATEVYFAEAQSVPSVSVQNHTVNHIDISVEGSASIKVPLAYGTYRLATLSAEDLANIDNIDDLSSHITGYRSADLVVTHGSDVTLEVDRVVPITRDDIRKADITAYTEWTGQRVYLDDVYVVTGYSGNAETTSDTPQVRLEGVFKVSDMEPAPSWCNTEDRANNWSYWENGQDTGRPIKDVRLERPIHYNVDVNKPVTFTMTYYDEATDTTYLVLKDNEPFRVKMDVSVSSSFTYWDSDNTCPGIDLWTYGRDRWRNGEIRSNDNANIQSGDGIALDAGPGMDFRLGASIDEANHDIVAVEVTKYVEGIFGEGDEEETRLLSLQDETECGINVYQNNSATPLHEKTLVVGKDGIGMFNDYDVTAGTYSNPAYAQISEDPNTVANELTDASGKKWTYHHSRMETEFAYRNDGNSNPSRYVSQDYTKDDAQFLSASEVIGEYSVPGGMPYTYKGENHDGVHEYNRFLEFYVFNIYEPKKYPVKLKKVDTANPTAATGLTGAQFDLYGPYDGDRSVDTDAADTGRKESKFNTTAITTGADGTVSIGNLESGTFYLYETKAPDGYNLLASPIKIVVDSSKDGTSESVVSYYQDDNSIDSDGDKTGLVVVGGTTTIAITNNAGYELPSTGGSGTALFALFGFIMVACAGFVLVRQ